MNLTATHINYYYICKRKLWLFANGINMEHTSEAVAEGKLLHETSYPQRAERYTEIELSFLLEDGTNLFGKIDFFDAKNKIIHEVKKSAKMEDAHEWQVKYYIWLLGLNGIDRVTGIIEYPKFRETKEIQLTEADRKHLQDIIRHIETIIPYENCPDRINKKFCQKCSYFDFCYAAE